MRNPQKEIKMKYILITILLSSFAVAGEADYRMRVLLRMPYGHAVKPKLFGPPPMGVPRLLPVYDSRGQCGSVGTVKPSVVRHIVHWPNRSSTISPTIDQTKWPWSGARWNHCRPCRAYLLKIDPTGRTRRVE